LHFKQVGDGTIATPKHDSLQTEQGSGNILNGWRKRYPERNIKIALFH
jgi:hypothetical protein